MPRPVSRRSIRIARSALPALLVASLAWAASAQEGAADGVGAFRAKMEKWVETRQIVSEEETDWEVEQETLRATRDLLRQQKDTLQKEIEELLASHTQSDEERRDLLLRRGEHQRSARALEQRIRAMEEEVLALAPRLPEPLQEKLELLLVQIPEDPESSEAKLGQRLMNVLGVLAQAEKWNGTATFVGETRAVDGDQKVQVRTLYWGLGQAVYVAAQGRTAGVGRPAGDGEGWEFTSDPSLVDEAGALLDIYEGNVDEIRFVRLPVEIR